MSILFLINQNGKKEITRGCDIKSTLIITIALEKIIKKKFKIENDC